jgi:peptidoglycan/LPS O-acetylase OafA/YrhL
MFFLFVVSILLVLSAPAVWTTWRRGRPVRFLTILIVLGSVLFALPAALEMGLAAKVANLVVAIGLWSYAAWGHLREPSKSSQDARVDGQRDGR